MTRRRFGWIAWGLCLLGVVWGCGQANPLDRRPISGKVTLDGAPLAQGSITFRPQQQGGVGSGAVITNGSYSIPAEKGLPAGKYRVMIFSSAAGETELPAGAMPGDEIPGGATPGETAAAPKELIPAEYNKDSKLAIEVGQEGPYEYNFPLVTKKE